MNYAVILSGGTGSRTGLDIPKQYYEVNGKKIIQYVIDTIEACDFIDKYIVVAAEEWHESITVGESFLCFAKPGENRQISIYNALRAICENVTIINEEDKVIIQDAVRPNTSIELYKKCFDFSGDYDGAMPVIQMKDTVYLSEDGKQVTSLLNRSQIYAGQAPEAFRLNKYIIANEKLLPNNILKINGSTEPAIIAGMRVQMIDGEESNYKITTAYDIGKLSN